MTTKEIRSFDEQGYNIRLQELNKQRKAFEELYYLIPRVGRSCDPTSKVDSGELDSLIELVNTKTGFKNTRMSFQALELENEYTRIQELKEASKDISRDMLADTLEFKNTFLKELKEDFTIYWTSYQLKALKQIDKVIDSCNLLPPEHRKLLGFNRSGELAKGPFFDRQFN